MSAKNFLVPSFQHRPYGDCPKGLGIPPTWSGLGPANVAMPEEKSMRLLPALAAALSLIIAGDTRGDTITGSYSGFVFSTPANGNQYFDYQNFFGFGWNANLGGLPISGTFTYDPSGATQQCSSATYCNYLGVMDTITATIGGHTISVAGTQYSVLSLTNHEGGGQGTEFGLLALNNVDIDIAVLVRTFTDQFSINPSNPYSPRFSVSNPDQFIGQLFFSDPTGIVSGFNFTITHLDVRCAADDGRGSKTNRCAGGDRD
jgi:hypothetical protein